jgi:hypothetical protein
MKPGMAGLFKNARKIGNLETFLNEKTYRLSNTNESSPPHASKGKDKTLAKPINCSKNNRSMSNEHLSLSKEKRGKVIQRTVSIVIDGKNKDIHNEKDFMNTLSRIILGNENSESKFFI